MREGETSEDGEPKAGRTLSDLVERFFTSRRVPPAARDIELVARGERLTLASGLVATAWGDGPTVLLAHGWNSRGSHWISFIEGLGVAGFRAVAIDAPAHGDSPGTQTNAFHYGMELVGLGKALGPLAAIVGHSFGAAALMIALDHGLDARRAVTISGPASIAGLVDRWAIAQGIPEEERPFFLKRVAEKVGVTVDDFDMLRVGSRLTTPGLVVHDRTDKDIPVAEAEALAETWSGSRAFITERYGHNRILIAKEVVREVVGFLSDSI